MPFLTPALFSAPPASDVASTKESSATLAAVDEDASLVSFCNRLAVVFLMAAVGSTVGW